MATVVEDHPSALITTGVVGCSLPEWYTEGHQSAVMDTGVS